MSQILHMHQFLIARMVFVRWTFTDALTVYTISKVAHELEKS